MGQTSREGTHATRCQPSGGYTCRISDGIGFALLELGAQGSVLPTGNKDMGIDLIVYHICYRTELSKYHDLKVSTCLTPAHTLTFSLHWDMSHKSHAKISITSTRSLFT